ncbi:MAG: hypothetical protein K9N49_01025 [Candidatus Marinimicrobia bacterium]|nr:hypothetical protein [Candidatus Neomarinimicrobiota bacterium]
MMKSGLFRLSACLFIGAGWLVIAEGQTVGVSISVDGQAVNSNAMLDVQSPPTGDGKRLLMPRVTLSQRTSADSALAGGLLNDGGQLRGGAAQGLLVYQTDDVQGLYYNTSATASPTWAYVGSGNGDFRADGSVPMTGRLNMNGQSITNVGESGVNFSGLNVAVGNSAFAYSSTSGSVAIGRNATARYRTSGVALGMGADGDYNGIAIGYMADGQYSNIAIGYASSAYSGYDRVAIGRSITNRRNDSVAMRGTLYLDGGTGVLYRASFGVGAWTAKAFTIDHPLDPEHKVLRHYCLEGPEVWNVYAGNVLLVKGRAVVELPDYYGALNREGSEVYHLTVVDGAATLFPQVKVLRPVAGNTFEIAGTHDVRVSWAIQVLRNDEALLNDLKNRPVEQMKRDLPSGQIEQERRVVNTLNGN